MSTGPMPRQARRARRRRRVLAAYALLLVASWIVQWLRPPTEATREELLDRARADDLRQIEVESASGTGERFAYYVWNRGVGSSGVESGGEADPGSPRVGVILVHGSPGQGADFATLAPRLAAQGRTVFAPDLLGFGSSTRSPANAGALANARAIASLVRQEKLDRVHLVGWSLGGPVVVYAGHLLEEEGGSRGASVTLLAASAAMRTESSGGYWFERFSYALGRLLFVELPRIVPHFGVLGPEWFRAGAMKFFSDTDLRPIEGILGELSTPTLVLHGSRDILTPLWMAQSHAVMTPGSRLVVLEANHFIPFLQAEEAADAMNVFFSRHDTPGVGAEGGVVDLSRTPERRARQWWIERRLDDAGAWLIAAPWTLEAAIVLLLVARWPRAGAWITATFVARQELDVVVAAVGIGLGLGLAIAWRIVMGARSQRSEGAHGASATGDHVIDWARRLAQGPGLIGCVLRETDRAPMSSALGGLLARPDLRRVTKPLHFARGAVEIVVGVVVLASVWAILGRVPAIFGLPVTLRDLGLLPGAASLLLLWWAVGIAPLLLTWTGRRQLRAGLRRRLHHEFWPSWVFYAPLAPYVFYLGWKHRSLGTVICCNPGVDAGGGIVGERKSALMAGLNDPTGLALVTVSIPGPSHAQPKLPDDPGGTRARLGLLHAAQARQRELAYPVVLKPESAQRGFAFRVASSDADALAYLAEMTRDAVAQQYHPGPNEVGVFWSRWTPAQREAWMRDWKRDNPGANAGERAGFIFSITAKAFPVVEGDGERTLEELIYASPRLSLQAPVFLARHAARRSWVPEAGQRVTLARAGNHCQGTLFYDGGDLVTPELERAIDRLAREFKGPVDRTRPDEPSATGGELDFVRFDLRYADERELRAGRGFGIVEVNGTFGESTNLYDPARSTLWAYRVLFAQWRQAFALGAERKKQGARPMTVATFSVLLWDYYKDRPGSALAD